MRRAEKKERVSAAPARDAKGRRRQTTTQSRDDTRQDKTRRDANAACRRVDCAAADRRDSRADPATLCAAKHSGISITASACYCCLRPRLVVVLACTTPSRLSAPSYQQICLRLHTDAYSRCQGLIPALHASISSTAVRSVRGVVRAADRTCYQQRARHPEAEPCTHQTKRCRSP
jgi:hypothetical protein